MIRQRRSSADVRRARPGRALCGGLFALALLLQGGAAVAASSADELEPLLAAERQRALTVAGELAALSDRLKADAAARVAALGEAGAAARADLDGIRKDLLAVMTRDDPEAIRVVRTRLGARQAEVDAIEGEKAFALKEAEEAERERDAWKGRAATLELALRMDMKVMLADPAEVEDRQKRVDAASKEIDYQAGQMRKYASRRDAAAADLTDLRHRLAALGGAAASTGPADWRRAREEQARHLQRLAAQQEEWFKLNRLLEERARRNVAFARTDYLISRRYAAALGHKADLRRADDAQAAAGDADARLAAMRQAVTPLQQGIAAALAGATRQAEAALKTLGDARTAQEQEPARNAYALTQMHKSRGEAESDCWKEFIALEKARAAFSHELADRARGIATDRSIFEINQEEEQLRDSLGTSEEYVRGLEAMVRQADDRVESARRALGLTPAALASLTQSLADILGDFEARRPPPPDLLSEQMQALAQRAAEDGAPDHLALNERREVAAALIARLAQREMLRTRKGISEQWLENSRAAIRGLERLAGARLWLQHDPRLNGVTCQEAGALASGVAGDAFFAWDCLRLRVRGMPGVPGGRGFLRGLAIIALLGLAGWACARRARPGRGVFGLGPGLVAVLPPLVGAGFLALRPGRGNLAFEWAGVFLLALAAWLVVRDLMLALTRERRPPSGATLGGGLFRAVNAIAGWSVILLPFHRLAGTGENAWDVQAVIARLWLFGVCLALCRLALHPTLMGRLLSRRSEHRGLRWLGGTVAVACIVAAALAALPYVAGLDNLGRTVLHAVEASLAVLLAALIGTRVAGWGMRRPGVPDCFTTGWIRAVQALLVLVAGVGAASVWWRLLNRVVLAPNAPPPVQELVKAATAASHMAVRLSHRELAGGMTVSNLLRGIVVFLFSLWVSRVFRRLFLQRVLARTPMDEATRLTFSTIFGYLLILLGFLVALNVAGSSLQNLALLAGAITVGLGFGLQSVINNFVSSLLIHFSRTIRVGDYIEVGGTCGTVREIGLRSTMIYTNDGITVLVPNGSFISANIINWTNPSRRTRLHVPLTVTRQADLTAVTELAISVARQHPLVLKEPAPVVEVRSVTSAQVTLELLAWTEKPERLASIVGELNLALDRPFRDKGFAV